MKTFLLLALLLTGSAQAQAPNQDKDAARRLDDARETIVMQRISRMPDAMRFLARNSRSVEDQLLILKQATSFDIPVRTEVARLVVYMDPGTRHLEATLPACSSLFQEAQVVCVYVASRVQGNEANRVLLDTVVSSDWGTAPMAAQSLMTRTLDREDAARLERVFDSTPGPRWAWAVTALCASMDADRAIRIRGQLEKQKALDASLLFNRLYGDPTRMGECTLSQNHNPVPARCNACIQK